ncbi:hypothetical protein KGF57_002429 [Candida theae]|uniref:Uncharacterized protein n=1 Tax=Candida theae TaxID=1198502 RepID=A0AAD5FYY6_9ASCO|nr:uncharacterized protein KGF57_002429 [Candida theae]KAI5958584.1 hypothetical protein KGF57_002429 [Candida theae]
MIHETSILPGVGIGNNIKLGSTLYDVINELNKYNYKYQVIYSETKYYESPILVQIVDLDIRLTFQNRMEQVLCLIEFLHLDGNNNGGPLRLMYKNQSLNEFEQVFSEGKSNGSVNGSGNNKDFDVVDEPRGSPLTIEEIVKSNLSNGSQHVNGSFDNGARTKLVSSGPSFQLIYNKLFGPTYPGVFNKTNKSYILSYPGIAFKYKIVNEELCHRLNEESSELMLDTLINWDDNPNDIVCNSIAIFRGKTWKEYRANKSDQVPISQNCCSKFAVDLDTGVIKVSDKGTIEIGKSTQQDVIDILGPPDDRFNKHDSRLLIHNYLSDDSLEEEGQKGGGGADDGGNGDGQARKDFKNCKFHNYYKLGVDILYDLQKPLQCGTSGSGALYSVVNKVVLHNGGIVEDLSFMKWNRCNWTIKSSRFEDPINSTMYFDNLPAGFKSLTPVFLNRYESEFIDNDLDVIDIPYMDTDNDSKKQKQKSLVHHKRNSAKLKRWGQSKLYGLQGCIVEVLNSNGCISSITIY